MQALKQFANGPGPSLLMLYSQWKPALNRWRPVAHDNISDTVHRLSPPSMGKRPSNAMVGPLGTPPNAIAGITLFSLGYRRGKAERPVPARVIGSRVSRVGPTSVFWR